MLKKQNRLAKITSANKSKLFTSPLFNLKVSENQERKLRFAFIVSKRIDKRAVVRNKTKRILRTFIEKTIDKLKNGQDIVIICKKALTTEQAKEASHSLEIMFRRANILK